MNFHQLMLLKKDVLIQKLIFWVPKSKQVGTKMGSVAPWVASRVDFSVALGPPTFPLTFYCQLEFQFGSQPRWPKNRSKNRSFLNASWDRFLVGFSWILVAKWKQVGTKLGSQIDLNLEGRFFKNRALAAAGARFFRIWGVQVGSKNRLKIDPKVESKMGCILASIFKRFW